MFTTHHVSAAERRAKFTHQTTTTVRPSAPGAFPLRREDVRRIVAELLG